MSNRLTIKNIEGIVDYKLPRLDGYTIEFYNKFIETYEFHIRYYNNSLKMILRVEREPTSDIYNQYVCRLYNVDGATYKGQWVIDRNDFKTKLGFIMRVSDMVNEILLGMAAEQEWMQGLSSVSANTHITQSYDPTLHPF